MPKAYKKMIQMLNMMMEKTMPTALNQSMMMEKRALTISTKVKQTKRGSMKWKNLQKN